jgi:hypothetical protein
MAEPSRRSRPGLRAWDRRRERMNRVLEQDQEPAVRRTGAAVALPGAATAEAAAKKPLFVAPLLNAEVDDDLGEWEHVEPVSLPAQHQRAEAYPAWKARTTSVRAAGDRVPGQGRVTGLGCGRALSLAGIGQRGGESEAGSRLSAACRRGRGMGSWGRTQRGLRRFSWRQQPYPSSALSPAVPKIKSGKRVGRRLQRAAGRPGAVAQAKWSMTIRRRQRATLVPIRLVWNEAEQDRCGG